MKTKSEVNIFIVVTLVTFCLPGYSPVNDHFFTASGIERRVNELFIYYITILL